MRYILFARKSPNDHERQTLQDLARDLGLEIGIVIDEARPTRFRPNRPIFAKMVKLIETGQFDAIFCRQFDRLSRHPIDTGMLARLASQGRLKSVRSPNQELVRADGLGFTLEVMVATAAYKDRSARVKRPAV